LRHQLNRNWKRIPKIGKDIRLPGPDSAAPAMKLVVRRIGNSLGVSLPKSTLDAWGVGEGDTLELPPDGVRRPVGPESAHARLDELKRSLSMHVVRECTPRQIRAQRLANLHRWKQQGSWVSAYDEWSELMSHGSDGELFSAMLGRDENANRLRQSMPYVGLLPQAKVKRIYEETGP
jgi:antitoxin component of MazEF toxin-antitoxin module